VRLLHRGWRQWRLPDAPGDHQPARRPHAEDAARLVPGPGGHQDDRRLPDLRDEQGRDLVDAAAAATQGGAIAVRGADGNTTVQINGGVSGGSILLNGSALDVAEAFDLRDADQVEPGHVVVIDPEKPGRLKRSTRAYDRRVAGVIAGAGGLTSGIVLGARSDNTQSKPVALSGRVYCWADATFGAIRPGDLLTTSPTAGHAMRASSTSKAQGAIIGKAMEGLDQGKGKILILVNLQ